jgi:hypothetical protein
MRLNKNIATFAAFVVCAMSSCSGLPKAGGGGGATGTLPISLTLSSVPAGVPSTISILSFTVSVSGITLTSQTTGTVTNLSLINFTVDLNKLLSDSAFLGQFLVASDQYSKIEISIASSSVVFCTSSSGVAGCTPGSIAKVSGGASTLTFSYSPALNATSPGIGVRFRLFMSRALILNSTGSAVQSIDFTQPLVGFSEQLPLAANLTSPQLDYVDDITGVVTKVGTSSVTIQSATVGTVTANVASTSNFSSQNCTTNGISCAQVGQVADMDTIVNADGTFTLLLFDPFDTNSDDWVEGVISLAPTSASQFSIVVTNFVPASSGTQIGGSVHLGDQLNVNLASGAVFAIDQKNLILPSNSFTGGQDTSVLFPGQVVAVRSTALTVASGSTPASVTVDSLLLRFSRLAGLSGSPGPNFTFTPSAPFFGIVGSAQTQETSNVTNYDLPVSGTSLTAAQAAGISALYLGPPSTAIFAVSKVRQ